MDEAYNISQSLVLFTSIVGDRPQICQLSIRFADTTKLVLKLDRIQMFDIDHLLNSESDSSTRPSEKWRLPLPTIRKSCIRSQGYVPDCASPSLGPPVASTVAREQHPYKDLLDDFQRPNLNLTKIDIQDVRQSHEKSCYVVTTSVIFDEMLEQLKLEKELGICIKINGRQVGRLCWFLIGTRESNYLVDIIALPNCLEQLKGILLDKNILKIVHGAKEMFKPLQLDYGLYFINIFDTKVAMEKLGIKNTLRHYIKKYDDAVLTRDMALTAWHVRPMTSTAYTEHALNSINFLIPVYLELANALMSVGLLEKFLQDCHKSCRVVYTQITLEQKKKNCATTLMPGQRHVLKNLEEWRNMVANENNTLPHNVMSDLSLFKLAKKMVLDKKVIMEIVGCEYVNERIDEVHKIILEGRVLYGKKGQGFREKVKKIPKCLSPGQTYLFQKLNKWRERVAEENDTFPSEVMCDRSLFRLAKSMIINTHHIINLVGTPYISERINEVYEMILEARRVYGKKVKDPPQVKEKAITTPPPPPPFTPGQNYLLGELEKWRDRVARENSVVATDVMSDIGVFKLAKNMIPEKKYIRKVANSTFVSEKLDEVLQMIHTTRQMYGKKGKGPTNNINNTKEKVNINNTKEKVKKPTNTINITKEKMKKNPVVGYAVDKLRQWRNKLAMVKKVRPCNVMSDESLHKIAWNVAPQDKKKIIELAKSKYVPGRIDQICNILRAARRIHTKEVTTQQPVWEKQEVPESLFSPIPGQYHLLDKLELWRNQVALLKNTTPNDVLAETSLHKLVKHMPLDKVEIMYLANSLHVPERISELQNIILEARQMCEVNKGAIAGNIVPQIEQPNTNFQGIPNFSLGNLETVTGIAGIENLPTFESAESSLMQYLKKRMPDRSDFYLSTIAKTLLRGNERQNSVGTSGYNLGNSEPVARTPRFEEFPTFESGQSYLTQLSNKKSLGGSELRNIGGISDYNSGSLETVTRPPRFENLPMFESPRKRTVDRNELELDSLARSFVLENERHLRNLETGTSTFRNERQATDVRGKSDRSLGDSKTERRKSRFEDLSTFETRQRSRKRSRDRNDSVPASFINPPREQPITCIPSVETNNTLTTSLMSMPGNSSMNARQSDWQGLVDIQLNKYFGAGNNVNSDNQDLEGRYSSLNPSRTFESVRSSYSFDDRDKRRSRSRSSENPRYSRYSSSNLENVSKNSKSSKSQSRFHDDRNSDSDRSAGSSSRRNSRNDRNDEYHYYRSSMRYCKK